MSVEDSKRCCACNEVKALGNFASVDASGRLRGRCRDCQRTYNRLYQRKRRGTLDPADRPTWDDRLWQFVEDVGDCWEWRGWINGMGYGGFYAAKRCGASTTTLPHRLAYELVVGVIPDGLVLDHLCRNPPCVNPAHLEPVTNAENIRRGIQATKTHCERGHPLSGDNLYVNPSTRKRTCRTCQRAAWHRWNQKRKGALCALLRKADGA